MADRQVSEIGEKLAKYCADLLSRIENQVRRAESVQQSLRGQYVDTNRANSHIS